MSETSGPGRRGFLQALAVSAGAGLALPGPAESQAAHHHAPSAAPVAPSAAPATPFLDPHQLETLASLAEAIVPGSTDAGVAPFVDRLLAEDTPERKRAFLAALGAIQAESTARHGRPWLGLAPEEKAALLTVASTDQPSKEPRFWRPGQPVLVPAPPPLPPTLRDRFDLLKERIATAYYSSEAGMKELGWTGNLIHEGFPGCPHPRGHGSGS
jgi:hypothetical protein